MWRFKRTLSPVDAASFFGPNRTREREDADLRIVDEDTREKHSLLHVAIGFGGEVEIDSVALPDTALDRAIASRAAYFKGNADARAERDIANFHAARRRICARIDFARRFDHILQVFGLVNNDAHQFGRAPAQLLWRECRRISGRARRGIAFG